MSKPAIVKWLIGLAAVAMTALIAGLAWLPGTTTDAPDSSAQVLTAAHNLPQAVEPGFSGEGSLTAGELRFCITEELRLEAIRPHLWTEPAVERHNQLAADFNSLCAGRTWSDEERERVNLELADSLPAILDGAVDEIQQLNDAVPVSITRIQELLVQFGYDPGEINGQYGEQTRAAIEGFQKQIRIAADGLVSPTLLDQLSVAFARNVVLSERCRIRGERDTSNQPRANFRC